MNRRRTNYYRQSLLFSTLKIVFCLALGIGLVALALSNKTSLLVKTVAPALAHVPLKTPTLKTPFGEVIIRNTPEAYGTRLEVQCVRCQLNSAALASQPIITQNARLSGKYKDQRFVGTATAGNVAANLDVLWQGLGVKGKFSLPNTQIAELYRVLRSVVPESDKATITGELGGSGFFSWPDLTFSFSPKLSNFSVSGLVNRSRYLNGPFSYFGKNARRERVRRTSGEGTPNWLPLTSIGELLPQAVTAAEDIAFYHHPGFDLASILEAANENKELGRLRRGGSTLTQQLAKNLFLTDERNYVRKLRELLYTVDLEHTLGKKRIMELYLNIVEWGPDIVGAKQASEYYFNKAPGNLLPEEAAWLAGILRHPIKAWQRDYLRNKPNIGRLQKVLYRMKALTDEQRQEALSRPLVFFKH